MSIEAFQEGYANAVQQIIPPELMRRAEGIVVAYRQTGPLEGAQVFAMARILFVDDNPNTADSCKTMGESAGNTVVIASSASEAEKLLMD